MKPIELSDLQKSKLLKMCKDLFSQYYNIGFYSMQSNMLQISETKNSLVFIHWFEFCMTKLPEKIFGNPKNNFQGINGRPYWCEKVAESFAKVHPVDYLYEQFKQLK